MRTSYTWWVIDAPGGDPAAVKNWKITATHKLPGGEKTYYTDVLSRDYTGYGLDSHFLWNNGGPGPGPDPGPGAESPSLGEDTSVSF